MATRALQTLHLAWLSCTALCAIPALAQSEASGTAPVDDGEIIVTATRREQSLQTVPLAVSVIDGERLRSGNLNNLRDIATEVPSLNFRTAASNKDQALFVRGLGTVSTSPGVESSVSTVLDGVVLARQGQATLDLIDIERVEVLRGPQGTLFGKNASAGVLNIVSRRPGNVTRGFVDLNGFEGGEARARLALSGPVVSDRLALGFSAFLAHYDGNVRNVFDGDRVNGFDRAGGRVRLRFTPDDAFELLLTGDYAFSTDTTPQGVPTRTFLTAFPTGVVTNSPAFATAFLPSVAAADGRTINSNYRTEVTDRNYGLSGEITVNLGDHVLTSITAWRAWDNVQRQDQDRLPGPVIGIAQLHDVGLLDFTQFSQEVRVASPAAQALSYVFGGFYFRGRNRENYRRETTVVTATTRAVTSGVADYGVVNENLAVFGEANLRLGDSVRLLAGARLVRDRLSFDFNRVSSSAVPVTGIQTNFIANGQAASTDVAGRAGIQFDIAPRIMAYATYSRGYKGPAYNPAFSMLPQDAIALRPELSDAYEFGFKSRLFGGLTLNVAAFQQDVRDYQVPFFDTFNNSPITRLINAGRARSRGIEADAAARLGELTLSGALAYTEAQIRQFTCPVGTNASCRVDGLTLPYAPRWRANARFEWRPALTDSIDLVLGADVNWRTSTQYSINQTPDTIEPGYAIVNGTIGIANKDGLRVMLLARNLTDRSYSPFLVRFGQGVARFVPRDDERYFGISLLKDF